MVTLPQKDELHRRSGSRSVRWSCQQQPRSRVLQSPACGAHIATGNATPAASSYMCLVIAAKCLADLLVHVSHVTGS